MKSYDWWIRVIQVLVEKQNIFCALKANQGNSLAAQELRTRGFHCRRPEFNLWLGDEDPASQVAGLKKKKSQLDVALNLKMLLRLCSDKELMYIVLL